MRYLKQSTASTVVLGPCVDSTDGVTAETALTISQADVRLSKNGGAFAQKNESSACTHMENGYYSCALSTTDTGTLGRLTICVNESGALPVRLDYMVLSADAYEALCGSTPLPVNATQISGDSAAADELERWMDGTAGAINELGIVDRGTAQSATTTTLVLRSAVGFADDALIGATILQTGGTNSPQMARVTDYVGSTDTATVASWPNGTPSGTITYVVFATTPDSGSSGLDAAGVRSAIGLASANLDTQLAAIDDYLDTEVAAIKAKTDNLPSDPADASVVAGLIAAVEAKVDTIDTVVDAVKAKTDSLTFTVAGAVDANIQRINDVALTGNGATPKFGV